MASANPSTFQKDGLWGTADHRTSTNRVGFNVPERVGRKFPAHLHWDVRVKTPIPFGTAAFFDLTDGCAYAVGARRRCGATSGK
jgi:hypothetical protein